MKWVSEAITRKAPSIMKAWSRIAGERVHEAGMAVTREEMLKEAELTVELLPAALEDRKATSLAGHWEAIGYGYSGRGVALAEIPKTLEILKTAIWKVLEAEVEQGAVSLGELVDSMMEVESVLADCWLEMIRSYLGSREMEKAARTARMEALYSLTDVLTAESDVEHMYRNIAEQVVNLTGLSRCSLMLFDERGALRPVSSNFTDSLEDMRRFSEADLRALSSLVSAGSPVVLEKGSSTLPEFEDVLEKYRSSTVLVVPLRTGGKSLGLLLLDEGRPGEFSRQQIDIAVAGAEQAAMVVEKSGLVIEMEARLKHMAAIGIVARAVMTELDPKEQLNGLLVMSTALVGADRGVIMLPDEMMGGLKTAAVMGPRGWEKDEPYLGPAAERAAEHGETVVFRRGDEDDRFAGLETGVERSITAPLKIRDRVIGVISVAAEGKGDGFTENEAEMFENFAAQAAVSIENTLLYERLQDAYLGTVASLAAAIEARDPFTVGHSARVTQYAVAIAEAMELPQEDIEQIRLASILHDLGKIGVPDNILNKSGMLDESEYTTVKMHPMLSMKIIEPLPHLGNIIPMIYHHHERYSGGGYMDGLVGDRIPLGARVIAVADAFEAMTTDRPYRKAMTRQEAMGELRRNAGSQFDPRVVHAFLELLEKSAPVT